ncbi:hypothetical protein ACWDA7_16920, partial [Streptomyces sp. NPDC001156]
AVAAAPDHPDAGWSWPAITERGPVGTADREGPTTVPTGGLTSTDEITGTYSAALAERRPLGLAAKALAAVARLHRRYASWWIMAGWAS